MAKTTKSTSIDAITINELARMMQQQQAQIAGLTAALVDTKAKPAPAKAEPAKAAAPELAFTLTEGKWGTAVALTFEGRKASRWIYVNELRILAKHINEVLAATKHIK